MSVSNLKTLARFTDSLSFLYLEHAVIEKEDQSIAAFTAEGRISLPAANLSTLMLGPGTRVTHAAIQVLASSGCVIAWVGADGLRHYAAGQTKTRSSAALERQCAFWADADRHMSIVRRLYTVRFTEPIPATMSLQQIRGREGARVRDAYHALARRYGIDWSGRSYKSDDWASADPVNRALSAANAALYAVTLAALHALGYSPGLGFIHTGKQLSFVYDIADVFKLSTSVPAAFAAASESTRGVESRARALFREKATELRLLDRLNSLLGQLFIPDEQENSGSIREFDEDPSRPGPLWDPASDVPGGVQHADDGA